MKFKPNHTRVMTCRKCKHTNHIQYIPALRPKTAKTATMMPRMVIKTKNELLVVVVFSVVDEVVENVAVDEAVDVVVDDRPEYSSKSDGG